MHTAHGCGCVHVHLCLFAMCRHVHSYTYVCTIHAHAYVCVCVSVCVVCVCVCVRVCVHVCVCPSMCTHMGVQRMYMCMSVPDCVAYISIHCIQLHCVCPPLFSAHTFSACSNSATLAVECTRTFEPNTLILSVSIAVLAMRIRAFSMRFGWFTPTFFSRR